MARRIRGNEEQPRLGEAQLRRQAIEGFKSRKHYNPIWVDQDVLASTGILERVTEMLTVSGWPGLMTLHSEADVDDTSEFMGTFHYVGRENQQGFSYRHRNQPRNCSMNRLREAFGWIEGGEVHEPVGGDWGTTWASLAPTVYNGGNNSPKDFTDPAMFYLHQIMSKTLFARKNVDKVGQLEMGVLAMLRAGTPIHWGHYFCKHIENLRANSPISCGGMITYFLRRMHRSPEVASHTTLYGTKADYTYFRMGRHIEPAAEGHQWVYYNDERLRPPAVAPRGAGRPRGGDRGRRVRGRALVIHEPQADADQPAQPGQYGQDMLNTLFNAFRASIFAGRPFQPMPAPPGWRLGDPVPPEYLP